MRRRTLRTRGVERVGAVIPAAGSSLRMGADKMLVALEGIPLLAYTIGAFQSSPSIDEIVVVASAANQEQIRRLVREHSLTKVTNVCLGGARRQDSVWNGISSLSGCTWVVVHDGARPFVDETLIERGLSGAVATGSAVVAVPVRDTVKIADERGIVERTLPREFLWSVQTPQVFRYDVIADACANVSEDVTDDAQMVELRGRQVKICGGSHDNIKITTPEDLDLARLILARRKGARK